MNKKYIFIILIILILPLLFFRRKTSPKVIDNLNGKEGIFIYGDYVTYLDAGEVYVEEGARFIDKNGRNLSSNIITTYYTGKRQVFNIDSSYVNTYIVKYQVFDDVTYEASRVVVVRDIKPPKIDDVGVITLNLSEVTSFDVASKISATDESGISKIECDDVKEEATEQVINCDVYDMYDNKSSIRILFKVIN